MREILGVLVPFFAIVTLGYGAARFRLIWRERAERPQRLSLQLRAAGDAVPRRRDARLERALPTGVNLYLFSSRYVRDVGVFSTAILSSTVISVATLTLIVWLLAQPS